MMRRLLTAASALLFAACAASLPVDWSTAAANGLAHLRGTGGARALHWVDDSDGVIRRLR